MTDITHKMLVRAGARWLGLKCRVVATEVVTSQSERPDVIGWRSNGSCTVIECKVSRSDFLANINKPHEKLGCGVGDWRWFFAPKGLIDPNDLPRDWGLLEYVPSAHRNGYFVKQTKAAPPRERENLSLNIERSMLVSIAGRLLEACALIKAVWLGDEPPATER